MEKQNFNLSDHFESTKNKFIENLSSVYGHPHSLIDAELKYLGIRYLGTRFSNENASISNQPESLIVPEFFLNLGGK